MPSSRKYTGRKTHLDFGYSPFGEYYMKDILLEVDSNYSIIASVSDKEVFPMNIRDILIKEPLI